MDLAIFWFVALGVLLTVYAVLDGFDLGVGTLHLLARGDEERRIALNSIGPLWDGNEVWFVTFGGALFAAFPEAYATIMSTFYLPIVLLLFCLVGRAVSIELRSKHPSRLWRSYWDASFALSSTLVTFCFGLVAGNLVRGIPLDAEGRLVGGVLSLFHAYPVAVGLLAVLGATMHGAAFLAVKTEGALRERVRRWAWTSFGLFLIAYVGVTIATLVAMPHAIDNFERWPAAWGIVALSVLALANVPRAMASDRPAMALVSTGAVVASLAFLFGMALFPRLVPSTLSPLASLDIWQSKSSDATLSLMLNIALLGAPLIVSYTVIVYVVFHGKVKLGKFSY